MSNEEFQSTFFPFEEDEKAIGRASLQDEKPDTLLQYAHVTKYECSGKKYSAKAKI